MLCKSCRTDNPAGMKFCKSCGQPLDTAMRTCVNGHNYDASLPACPYCPRKDFAKTVTENDDDPRTVVERGQNKPGRPDKTIIDDGQPTLARKTGPGTTEPAFGRPTSPRREDKTVIYTPDAQGSPGQPAAAHATRKLVGWLVTFDLQPAGTDFRLYEGRSRIGRTPNNDIVVNSTGVSDEHCLLLYRDKNFILEDRLSTNGTFVNGKMIEEKVHLNDHDEIRIGNVTLKLRTI